MDVVPKAMSGTGWIRLDISSIFGTNNTHGEETDLPADLGCMKIWSGCKFVFVKPLLMILISVSLLPVLPSSLPQLRIAAVPGKNCGGNAIEMSRITPCLHILHRLSQSLTKGKYRAVREATNKVWAREEVHRQMCRNTDILASHLLKTTAPILWMSSLTWPSLKVLLSSSSTFSMLLLLLLNHFFWLQRRATVLCIYLSSHHWQLRQLPCKNFWV